MPFFFVDQGWLSGIFQLLPGAAHDDCVTFKMPLRQSLRTFVHAWEAIQV